MLPCELLGGHALREVPRFVDRPPQLVRDPVCDQLQLHVREDRRDPRAGGGPLKDGGPRPAFRWLA